MSTTPDAVPSSGAASGRRTSHTPPSVLLGLTSTEVALVVVTGAFLAVIAVSDARSPEVADSTLIGFALASWLPLWWMGRRPLPVLAVVLALEVGHLATVPLVAPEQFNSLPVAVTTAAYAVAVRRGFRSAWTAGIVAAVTLLAAGILTRPSDTLAANFFGLDLVLGITAAGVFVRSRRQRLEALEERAVTAEETREQEARRRVAQERLRMARELHDVVAHHLALVNAQAGVAEYLLRTDPAAAATALSDISGHTHQALEELRSTVGLLRQVDGSDQRPVSTAEDRQPAHGVADVPELLDVHRASGGTVTLTSSGPPGTLGALADLAAYRIVQESLTNVRKHAASATVAVELRWELGLLRLRVANTRPASKAPRFPVGSGYGLLGMTERASASGGTFASGPLPEGGYAVTATLPTASATTPRPPEEPLA